MSNDFDVGYLYKLSRPHFWVYLGGPFILGAFLGISEITQLLNAHFFLLVLYFLLPANVLVYGVNDYFDTETDSLNDKKTTKESRYTRDKRFTFAVALLVTGVLTTAVFVMLQDLAAAGILAVFVFLSYFYSAQPLRFKSRPFVDSISNVLYVLPGVLGYYLFSGSMPGLPIFLAAWLWAIAMHLFSAIPDIVPDRKANVITTAVVLGEKASLILCFVCWAIAALIVLFTVPVVTPYLLVLLYPLVTGFLLISRFDVAKAYWYFPYLNGLVGFTFSLWTLMGKV